MSTVGTTIFTVFAVTMFAASAGAKDDKILEAGRTLAQKLCASCHAIGRSGPSPLAKAPPFGVIANRYSVWSLQEALAEGIVTGHLEMPQFVLKPEEIDGLLTYWDTLTDSKAGNK